MSYPQEKVAWGFRIKDDAVTGYPVYEERKFESLQFPSSAFLRIILILVYYQW